MIRSIFALVGAIALVTSLANAAPPAFTPPASADAFSVAKRKLAPTKLVAKRKLRANPAPASFDVGVWTVHASSLDANFKTGNFSTPDKVVMTRAGGDVSADRANGNYKKRCSISTVTSSCTTRRERRRPRRGSYSTLPESFDVNRGQSASRRSRQGLQSPRKRPLRAGRYRGRCR